MYILASPCILNPSLRANGITSEEDKELFSRCIERCRRFNIEIVPLPCPETIFFGGNREPGPYQGRMDSKEFDELLNNLEKEVRKTIAERNEAPRCILGVDSSPTCGVTKTYFTEIKSEGRGVYLKRFGDFPAVDVKSFAKYSVYLAAPLFSEAEREYNLKIAEILKERCFSVHLPQELDDTVDTRNEGRTTAIYEKNLAALQKADIVVGVIDGSDADSGTAWEMGYATAKGKEVIALRTDFRSLGEDEAVNLMLEKDATVLHSLNELKIEMTRF